jgi:protein required for attachment to host cells
MKVAKDSWVVIADGSKALFARNGGPLFEPRLEVQRVLEAEPNPATHEQGADRPGRSFDRASHRRSAVGQTDWHAQAEAEFAKEVAAAIDAHCRAGDIPQFVLIAAPRMLASLREALPPMARERLAAEIDKDLTNHPVPDIEKVLRDL